MSSGVRQLALLAAGYFAVASIGHALSPGDDASGFFWLPAGLLVASFLLVPKSAWLAVLAGALIGDAAFGLVSGASAGAVAARTVVTVGQAALGAVLTEGMVGRPRRIRTVRDLLLFLFAASAMTTLGGAAVGAAAGLGVDGAGSFADSFWSRWGSSALGVLVLAPLLLAWSESMAVRRRRVLEPSLLLIVTLACIGLVFLYGDGIQSSLRIVLAVPVVWAGLRFGLRGVSTVNVVLALPVAFFTGSAVVGPGTIDRAATGIGPAQTLVAMLVVVGLALAAVARQNREQVRRLQESEREVRRLSRLYASLSGVNQAVLSEPSAASFLARTCRILAAGGDLRLAAVGRADREGHVIEPLAHAGEAGGFLAGIEIGLDEGPVGQGPAATAVREDRIYVCADMAGDPRTVPWRARAAQFGLRSSAALPIRRSEAVWGVLGLYAGEVGYFGDDEIELLEEIAANIGFALDNFAREESRRSAEAALRESEELFRLAMEHSPIGMAIVGTNGRWLEVNPAISRIMGYSREELLRTDFQSVTHADDLAADLELLAKVLAGEIETYRVEKRYLRKDRTEVWVQLDVALVRAPGGAPRHFLSKVQDITERREAHRRIVELNATLEQRVADRTRELEEANRALGLANRELEAFASSVSHDLRAPLRLIDGFSHLLAEKHLDPGDGEAQEDLAQIRSAAHRMGELIDSLLRLARISRGPLQREPVDIGALAADAFAALEAQEPERRVRIVIDPGLMTSGSSSLLRAVVENLIGNAWKFTSKVAEPWIQVGRVLRDGEQMLFVRDNGAGFDMKYSAQLFQAFQRLHREEDFPGSGIGLATVQRILLRHGGRIEAEGRPGDGACFYFTTSAPGNVAA